MTGMGVCREVGYEGFILSSLLSNHPVIPEVFYRESSFNEWIPAKSMQE